MKRTTQRVALAAVLGRTLKDKKIALCRVAQVGTARKALIVSRVV